jgi:RNA polymerase sigma factor (sigma-70 family)
VQETVIAIAKKMESFTYDPEVDSFKGWLLYLTRKQIALHYRKRQREGGGAGALTSPKADIELFACPSTSIVEQTWDQEWERNLMDAAIHNVKRQVNPKQFQIFNFYVLKEWPVQEVTKTLGVNAAQVYLAKHRVSGLIKKELRKLERTMI